MKKHHILLLTATAFLLSVSVSIAEERDKNREKVRQLDILTDTCDEYSGDGFENCVDGLVGHSALVMCLTLYKNDDAIRLACFDEQALSAGIKLFELSAK
jgi:hypothetical protein